MGVSNFHIPLVFTEVKIPVVLVLTKHDLLIKEHYCRHKLSPADKKAEIIKRAKQGFSEVTKQLSPERSAERMWRSVNLICNQFFFPLASTVEKMFVCLWS